MDIPSKDINYFLTLNDQSISNDQEENYQHAFDLVSSGNHSTLIPESIVDWMLAKNLIDQDIDISEYSLYTIVTSSNDNLSELSLSLGLTKVNKERVIRILTYLDKLDNDVYKLDQLPPDVINEIIKKLDCYDISLIYRLTSQFNRHYQENFGNLLRENLERKLDKNLDNLKHDELIYLCKLIKHIGENIKEFTLEEILTLCKIDINRGIYGHIPSQKLIIYQPPYILETTFMFSKPKLVPVGKNCTHLQPHEIIKLMEKFGILVPGELNQHRTDEEQNRINSDPYWLFIWHQYNDYCLKIQNRMNELGIIVSEYLYVKILKYEIYEMWNIR